MIIRNRDEIVSRGNMQGKGMAAAILEAWLAAADLLTHPRKMIRIEERRKM